MTARTEPITNASLAVIRGQIGNLQLRAGIAYKAAEPLIGFPVVGNAGKSVVVDPSGTFVPEDREEPIAAGTTSEYWRGDKTWQTLDKTAVGLGNVDNTSDLNKPVSTAQQTALNLKAPLGSPAFTGSPTLVQDQDAGTAFRIDNPNSGTTASAGIDLRNGALGTNDRLFVGLLGTGFTSLPAWQDAAVISTFSNISGGLRIGAAVGAITFEFNFVAVGSFNATAFTCVSATTASAANVFQSATNTALLRSTSSNRYKQGIQDLPPNQADKILNLRPIRFRSKAEADDPNQVHWGLVAEEVHEVLPVLVNYDSEGIPDGVQYDRIIPALLSVVKRLEARISALEALPSS